MDNNRGYIVESEMRKEWNGEHYPHRSVDFQTEVYLVEVKSCNLLNFCYNGNDKRPFAAHQHKKIKTYQQGRFAINLENHMELKMLADKEKKHALYLFVINYKGQMLVERAMWEQVDEFVRKDREETLVRICDIFREFEICPT